jgi:hypothetical protein
MLIDQAELLALPISGAAYTTMKADADLSTAAKGTPQLGFDAGNVVQSRYLAQALVYARIGGSTRKDEVVAALRGLMGSEDTGEQSVSLRVNRQLAGWIWAADLVGMDRTLTGTRTGYTSTTWEQWLRTMITKQLAGHGSWFSVDATSTKSANNHAAWAHAVYAAIAVYLNDATHKTTAWTRFKSFIGDRTVPRTQSLGSVASRVLTYTCLHQAGQTATDDWVPLNNAAPCLRTEAPSHQSSLDADGLWIHDAERDGATYPTLGANGSDHYISGSTAGMMCAALTWRRGGQPTAFTEQSNWMKRCLDFSVRSNGLAAMYNHSGGKPACCWVSNKVYGTTYPTVANPGGDHTLSYADWLFA